MAPLQKSWWTGFIPSLSPIPACRKSLRGWGRQKKVETQRGSTSERRSWKRGQAKRTSRKASKAGELLGEGRGPGAGGWTGEVWRDSGPEAASALGRGREGGGYVSGFLPEVKFPKLVADRTQATHPDLGEGAEGQSCTLLSACLSAVLPSSKTSQLWHLSDLLPTAPHTPHPSPAPASSLVCLPAAGPRGTRACPALLQSLHHDRGTQTR